jgi:hypothetical protein
MLVMASPRDKAGPKKNTKFIGGLTVVKTIGPICIKMVVSSCDELHCYKGTQIFSKLIWRKFSLTHSNKCQMLSNIFDFLKN